MMTDICGLTHPFAIPNFLEKGVAITGNLAGRVVDCIKNLPQEIQTNPTIAKTFLVFSNFLFFLTANTLANFFDRSIEKHPGELSKDERMVKQVFLNLFMVAFIQVANTACAYHMGYKLSKLTLVAISVTAVIARFLLSGGKGQNESAKIAVEKKENVEEKEIEFISSPDLGKEDKKKEKAPKKEVEFISSPDLGKEDKKKEKAPKKEVEFISSPDLGKEDKKKEKAPKKEVEFIPSPDLKDKKNEEEDKNKSKVTVFSVDKSELDFTVTSIEFKETKIEESSVKVKKVEDETLEVTEVEDEAIPELEEDLGGEEVEDVENEAEDLVEGEIEEVEDNTTI